jgi:hypothetical protein
MIKKDQEIFTKCVTIRKSCTYKSGGLLPYCYYTVKLYGAVMGSKGKLIWRPIQDLGYPYKFPWAARNAARDYSERNGVPFFKDILCGMEVGETLGALLE